MSLNNPDKDWPYERECPVCNEKPKKQQDILSAISDPQGHDLHQSMEPKAKTLQISGSHYNPTENQIGGNHYRDMPIQPSEFIHRNKIGFVAGNVIKYVCRYSRKDGIQDLEKAKHYIELLIKYEKEKYI